MDVAFELDNKSGVVVCVMTMMRAGVICMYLFNSQVIEKERKERYYKP